MADHGGRTGRDTLDAVLQRISDLEGAVHELQGGNRLSLDRGDTDTFAVDKGAFEGQVMIQYDTEKPWYFSNGLWRPFCPDNVEYGYYETTGTTVVAADHGLDSWLHHSDTAILDLTDPQNPAFSEKGVYAVTGIGSFDGGWAGGTFPQGTLRFVPDALSWTTDFFFQSLTDPDDGFPPNAGFAATFQSEPGGTLQLEWWNFDSVSHFFGATQIRVQRIS